MTIWVDIDDLLTHLAKFNRPSGIQRVVYEASAALRRVAGERVAFVRRGHGAYDQRVVHWADVERTYRTAMNRQENNVGQKGVPRVERAHPSEVDNEELLGALGRAQLKVASGSFSLALAAGKIAARCASHFGKDLRNQYRVKPGTATLVSDVAALESRQSGAKLGDLARPGDIFLTLGAPWHHLDYERTVRWLRDDLRLSFALLIHDLVPMRHPEWCDRGVIETFQSWHRALLPLADAVFTLSRATASDVEQYLVEQSILLPKGVVPVSAGTVCKLGATTMAPERVVKGPYVLFVSTIEARKNHILLFRVWRRLMSELQSEEVPTLVFAGREGWLVSDFMRQLENTDWLDGKIHFISNPSDEVLHRLYTDCLFTVFPSFFEGWGLPVTESLSMGKPCIASETTSIPEAGGDLARYFNPFDVHDAYRTIRDAIDDPDDLARWTQAVRTGFRPVTWDRSADAILKILDAE